MGLYLLSGRDRRGGEGGTIVLYHDVLITKKDGGGGGRSKPGKQDIADSRGRVKTHNALTCLTCPTLTSSRCCSGWPCGRSSVSADLLHGRGQQANRHGYHVLFGHQDRHQLQSGQAACHCAGHS